MRVISGLLKGRTIYAPPGLVLRPTPNKVRDALFNILSDQIVGASFLDLYAGSGSVGIEALSRGATGATFVEQNRKHLQYLNKNLDSCAVRKKSKVFNENVEDFLARSIQPFNLVFLDPPYNSDAYERVLPRLKEGDIMTQNGRLIIEHFHKRSLTQTIGNIYFLRQYRYGETVLSFYGKQ